jgi:hypothetical protein
MVAGSPCAIVVCDKPRRAKAATDPVNSRSAGTANPIVLQKF